MLGRVGIGVLLISSIVEGGEFPSWRWSRLADLPIQPGVARAFGGMDRGGDLMVAVGDYMPNLPTSSWPRGKTVTEFSRASIPADLPGKFDDQIAEGLVGPGVGFVAEPETFLVKLNPFAGDAPEDHRAQTSVSDG